MDSVGTVEGTSLALIIRTSSRRPEDLDAVLESARADLDVLSTIVVSDSTEVSQLTEDVLLMRHAWLGARLRVHHCGSNIGPSGATNQALRLLPCTDPGWAVVTDDDIPLAAGYLRTIAGAITALARLDAAVAGIGRSGHRFDARKGRLVRPADHEIRGLVPVDYLATGFAPAFSVEAVRDIGGMREEFFIGHTEVALGLSLRRGGYNLYAIGWLWNPSGASPNWRGVTFATPRAPWRRYYSVRNLVTIVREFGGFAPAIYVSTRSLAGWLLTDRSLGSLRLTIRAVSDAWRGRMGRTVLPTGRDA